MSLKGANPFFRSQVTALTATALDVLVFLWIMQANPFIPGFATSVGVVVGGLFAFFANRHWSFRAASGSLSKQGIRWGLVWLGSAFLNVQLCVSAVNAEFDPALSRCVVAATVGVLFNFPLHHFFVFRAERPKAKPTDPPPPSLRSRLLKGSLRLVLFPWFLFTLSQFPARAFRELVPDSVFTRVTAAALGIFSYVVVGLPLTLVLLLELLISLNEAIIAEQADYRLQSDFQLASDVSLSVSGPKTPKITPVSPAEGPAYRRYLVEHFSPVVVQKVSDHPEWDIPVFVDFDGTLDPYDNVENEPKTRPNSAGVYGEVTAKTADSYYLTYSFYHVKDYDHPVREMLSRWTYHDNDNEGFHVRVDRKTMKIVSIETWFHNRFLVFNHSGKSTGTEPVHGRIHLENGSHPIIYVQPQGHGVRCAQKIDGADLTRNAKILRFRAGREEVRVQPTTRFEDDGTYELRGFGKWYESGAEHEISRPGALFSEKLTIGHRSDGTPIVAAAFISGEKFYDGGWSRPKPMWAWDDAWDDIPVFVWHALPSLSFESHEGTPLSHDYEFSRPVDEMLDVTPNELMDHMIETEQLRDDLKWNFEARGGHVDRSTYRFFAEKMLSQYLNYLFHALG